jgi:hypothetical protein
MDGYDTGKRLACKAEVLRVKSRIGMRLRVLDVRLRRWEKSCSLTAKLEVRSAIVDRKYCMVVAK